MTHHIATTICSSLLFLALSGCVTQEEKTIAGMHFEPKSASVVRGVASVKVSAKQTRLRVNLTGMTPGAHALRIHQTPDCDGDAAARIGPVFNPSAQRNNLLAVLSADQYGTVSTSFPMQDFMFDGPESIIGRSVALHASGSNEKARVVACGVITPL